MEEKDISRLRSTLGALKDFTARYPQSMGLLKPQIAELTAHICLFDAGEVRFESRWISRDELTAILEIRQREYETSELAEVEKRVYDGSQRDKGLMLHDGKWMTVRQTLQLPPESPTQLSESMEPLWNGDLEGARCAVGFLNELASQQTGAPKVRTERLITVVRNLFRAEANLTQRIIASTRESYEASIQDKNAKAWLKPNGFRTITMTPRGILGRMPQKSASARQTRSTSANADCAPNSVRPKSWRRIF